MVQEKRYKYLVLPLGELLDILRPVSEYNIMRKIKLPEDASPITAHYDFECREFLILMESQEYDPVGDGWSIPRIEYTNEMVKAVPVCTIDENKICMDNDVTRIWIDNPSVGNIEYARQILSRFGDGYKVPENFTVESKNGV
jgi:hypothetical protein